MDKGYYKKLSHESKFDRKYYACKQYYFPWLKRQNRKAMRRALKKFDIELEK